VKTALILTLFVICLNSSLCIGGDTFASAVPIDWMPYNDSGDTTTLTNTIANPSNDAFYVLNTPIPLSEFSVDLAGSSFDTYLRIYASDQTTQLWFNDDYNGTASALFNLNLSANTDYYICVEGYAANNGIYTMTITSDMFYLPIGAISNFAPIWGAGNIPIDTTISWDFGYNTETYDFFFDTVNPPVNKVVDNAIAGATGSYNPGLLNYGTVYYWQVISKSSNTLYEYESSVYWFTTAILPITTFPYSEAFSTYPPLGFGLSGTQRWMLSTSNGNPSPSVICPFNLFHIGNAAFITPCFDAQSITPVLLFDWSHFYNSSYPNDALEICISTDECVSWSQIWYRSGVDLDTSDGSGTATSFITEDIELIEYAGTSFNLRFNGISGSGYGPVLYFDNLCLINRSLIPATPQSIIITNSGNDVFLSWDEVSIDINGYPIFVDGYKVYANEEVDFVISESNLVGTAVSNTFLHPGASQHNRMFYKVVAVCNQ
jgi:hypothetical protein